MKRPKPTDLAKVMHFDFRKWREGEIVIAEPKKPATNDRPWELPDKPTEYRTRRCRKCRRIGLDVGDWLIHVAIVDTLGNRLEPHKACRVCGGHAKAPTIVVKTVNLEEWREAPRGVPL